MYAAVAQARASVSYGHNVVGIADAKAFIFLLIKCVIIKPTGTLNKRKITPFFILIELVFAGSAGSFRPTENGLSGHSPPSNPD